MVIFALSLTFLLGIVALALEGGHAESDRRSLQAVADGAALAGAEFLDADSSASAPTYDPPAARQTAAKYVFNALSGGTQAGTGPACNYSSNIAPRTANSCDPDGTHSLTITTPYNGHPEELLIRVDNSIPVIMGAVVGISQVTTAGRAVAAKLTGGAPFPFALYVGGNLTANGNANLQVGGNLFVRGCIHFTNSDELVAFANQGEAGAIKVLDDPTTAALVGGSSTSPQVWDQGKGTGCFAKVFSRDSYGAGGSGSTATCGKTDTAADVPGHFFLPCPAGVPPVTDLPPIVGFKHTDPCVSTAPSPLTSLSSPPAATNYVPGCYDACTANSVSGTFGAGIYGFIGTTCGGGSPNLIFSGDASGSGVSFVLTNGAGMCIKSCTAGAGKGTPVTLTFSAPTTEPNQAVLLYDCSGGSLGCSSGGGPVFLKGPGATVNFQQPALVFAPSSSCTLQANGTQVTVGQIICNDVSLQGGSASSAEQIFFGGPGLPSPLFDIRLIE